MTTTASISIDVPNLAQGVAFYCAAFGFSKKSEPVRGVAVLHGEPLEHAVDGFPTLEAECPMTVRRACLAVDDARAGTIFATDGDGLAEKSDIAIAESAVRSVGHHDNIAIDGRVDGRLNCRVTARHL